VVSGGRGNEFTKQGKETYMFRKTSIVATVLGGVLVIGGAVPSLADARSNCEKRVRNAEQNLQHEIDRHGEHGKNVETRRQQLERERQNCRMYDKDKERHDNEGDKR
jgi:hypothetical protein